MSTTPLNVPIPDIAELSQNAARLLQQSLAEASQAGTPAMLSAADLELARSNTKAFAFVQAVGLHGAYRYLRDFIARQAIPIKSEKEFLDGWLETYKMPRKEASAATGSAAGTGLDASLLPIGTLMQSQDGRQYRAVSDAPVAGGVVTASLIALVAGAAGNLAPGAPLTLVSPVAGVDAPFVTDAVSGISGGADRETDPLAVYRLQQRLSNPPMGGSPADYAGWALSLPSITRAWGIRNPAGPTSAGVIIMADGNLPNGLPTPAQRLAVLDYIRDPRRGPPDELFVIVPTLDVIDFQIRLTPDTSATRAATLAALKDLFFREAVPGGSIPHNHAGEAISAVVGEYNHSIIAPVVTSGGLWTAAGFDHLLALGTVAFVL
jgi:uncharacterized phage protein gp47/JayE